MSRFWSPIVRDLTPYVPGEQPRLEGLLKLNTNENPYGPGPHVLAAIKAEVEDGLRLYPDPTAERLRATVAAAHGLDAGNVFVGNGSDEVLAHAFKGLLQHEGPLLFPDITYSFYPVYCGLFGIAYETVPLDAELQVRIEDFRPGAGAIILPNPNAPTGSALPRQAIEQLLLAHPEAVVVIDEAYVDFGGESVIPLIARHPNLLVVQTLSKARSLAGLRVGLAFGDRPLIEALERVKDSFNSYPLDRLAQAGARAAYEDVAWFEASRAKVVASRQRLEAGLRELGFEMPPSAANFVFARHPRHAGAELAAALRARAIIVRRFDKPRIADHLRITVGTDEQVDRLLGELAAILAATP